VDFQNYEALLTRHCLCSSTTARLEVSGSFLIFFLSYLINSQEFVVIGGTAQDHNESRTISQTDKNDMLTAAKLFAPSLEVI